MLLKVRIRNLWQLFGNVNVALLSVIIGTEIIVCFHLQVGHLFLTMGCSLIHLAPFFLAHHRRIVPLLSFFLRELSSVRAILVSIWLSLLSYEHIVVWGIGGDKR